MLRFQQKHTSISLIYNDQTHVGLKLLLKAGVISACIHAVLLFIFHIHIPIIQTKMASGPTVFLDAQEGMVAGIEEKHHEKDFREQWSEKLHVKDVSFLQKNCTLMIPACTLHNIQDRKFSISPICTLPWKENDDLSPSKYRCRAYPIKLILHPELRVVHILDDGADTFVFASKQSIFCTPAFAEVTPQVDFQVDICVQTGKIVNIIPGKELVDKRLQAFAELFLRKLIFSTAKFYGKPILTGGLTLQFAGQFEQISPLIRWEVFR